MRLRPLCLLRALSLLSPLRLWPLDVRALDLWSFDGRALHRSLLPLRPIVLLHVGRPPRILLALNALAQLLFQLARRLRLLALLTLFELASL